MDYCTMKWNLKRAAKKEDTSILSHIDIADSDEYFKNEYAQAGRPYGVAPEEDIIYKSLLVLAYHPDRVEIVNKLKKQIYDTLNGELIDGITVDEFEKGDIGRLFKYIDEES